MRSLLLLRHATAEATRPGRPDRDRQLTPDGEREAAAVGDHLRAGGTRPDLVLCSPAVRARQTADALRLDAPVVVADPLYEAGTGDLLDLLRALDDGVEQVLVVAHAPGLPALVHELADPDGSDVAALATVTRRFPAATLATVRLAGPWSGLRRATLDAVRLP